MGYRMKGIALNHRLNHASKSCQWDRRAIRLGFLPSRLGPFNQGSARYYNNREPSILLESEIHTMNICYQCPRQDNRSGRKGELNEADIYTLVWRSSSDRYKDVSESRHKTLSIEIAPSLRVAWLFH